jgi:transcription factor SPN1
MFYSKCTRVLPEIKRVVDELLDRWMRPILRKSDNYRDKYREEKAVDSHRSR